MLQAGLPIQLSSFVGRESEIAEIMRLLTPGTHGGTRSSSMAGAHITRLLTLTGSGGIGKTRAWPSRLPTAWGASTPMACATSIWRRSATPPWSPLRSPARSGLTETAKLPVLDSVRTFLHDRRMLLLLDNFEHLIRPLPSSGICWRMRQACLFWSPAGRVCACPASRSSRCRRWSSPAWTRSHHWRRSRRSLALPVLERAWAVDPSFTLTPENAAAVAEICCRWTASRSAIELAAARVKALPVAEIAARLDHSLHLLTGGSRSAPSRHRSLQAALDWGFALLSGPERILFTRLAVFRGGFSLAAVESVCADAETGQIDGSIVLRRDDVLDLLANLIDKSLVVRERREDQGGRGATGCWRLSDNSQRSGCSSPGRRGPSGAVT